MRVLRCRLRGAVAQLRVRVALAVAALALAATIPAFAQTPPPGAIDVRKLQPSWLFPKVPLHTAFIVEVNKMGQVSRVRSGTESKNATFNAQTYGNVLQIFIRTPDGKAVSGLYRVTYQYDPKTQRIRRDVALIRAGGVNPNAEGAVNNMLDIAKRNKDRSPAPGMATKPRLPDLPQVMRSP